MKKALIDNLSTGAMNVGGRGSVKFYFKKVPNMDKAEVQIECEAYVPLMLAVPHGLNLRRLTQSLTQSSRVPHFTLIAICSFVPMFTLVCPLHQFW